MKFIHLVGAGAAEGAVDAANILKPALARGNSVVLVLQLMMNIENILNVIQLRTTFPTSPCRRTKCWNNN
jgi:hypothetical protein